MEIIRRNTDYAIRALVHLAINSGQVVSAGEIAASQEVPLDFLQKILQKFVRKGLVRSHRGIQGGFSLSREPGQVTVLELRSQAELVEPWAKAGRFTGRNHAAGSGKSASRRWLAPESIDKGVSELKGLADS